MSIRNFKNPWESDNWVLQTDVLDTDVLNTNVLENDYIKAKDNSKPKTSLEDNYSDESIVSKDNLGTGNLFIVLGSQNDLHNKYYFEKGNTNWDLVHSGFLLLNYKIGNPSIPTKIKLKDWIDKYMDKHKLSYLKNIVIFWHGVDGMISIGADWKNRPLKLEVSDLIKYMNSTEKKKLDKQRKLAIETIIYLGEKLANPNGGAFEHNLFFMNCELGQGNFSTELRKLYFTHKKLPTFNILMNYDYTRVSRNPNNDKQYKMNWGARLGSKINYPEHAQFRIINKNRNEILKYDDTKDGGWWPDYEVTCYHDLSIFKGGKPIRSFFDCVPK